LETKNDGKVAKCEMQARCSGLASLLWQSRQLLRHREAQPQQQRCQQPACGWQEAWQLPIARLQAPMGTTHRPPHDLPSLHQVCVDHDAAGGPARLPGTCKVGEGLKRQRMKGWACRAGLAGAAAGQGAGGLWSLQLGRGTSSTGSNSINSTGSNSSTGGASSSENSSLWPI